MQQTMGYNQVGVKLHRNDNRKDGKFMKKFRTSIAAFLLACVLGISLMPGSALATEWEGWYYDSIHVMDNQEVYINGVRFDVKTARGSYEPYVQFAPVARALGFEVAYNGDNHSVTATNGEKEVIIFLDQDENFYTKIWFYENGEKIERYLYKYAVEREGIAYVCTVNYDFNFWETVFNVKVITGRYNGMETYDFIQIDKLKQDVYSKLSHLNNTPSYTALVQNYTDRESGNVSFNLNSDLFGINIKGESGVEASVTKNGDAMMLDYQMDNGGIMNLYSLFSGPFTLGLDYYKDKIDVEQPVSAQVIFDGTNLYGKGDLLVETLALQNLGSSYNYPEDNDFREIAAERIDGKWVKAWLTDMQKQLIVQPVMESIRGEQIDANKIADMVVNSILDDYHYYYYYSENGIYDNIQKKINATVDLLGPDMLTYTEENGEKVITYRLTTDAFRSYQKACLPEYDNGAIYDEMELDLTAQTTIAADNTATSTLDGTFRINNIPNDYNIPFGSLEIQFNMSGKTIPQASAVSAPTDYVDFKQLYDESLLYRYNGI